jgi:two-component system cell cycle sensor histidine kinase/response regulator CckA
LHSSSILAVDDNRDISSLITRSLERCGFSINGFTDPHLALEDFEMNVTKYVLVISDFRMPGMNGIEFAIKIKEMKPDIKILLMTAFEINSEELKNVTSSVKVDEFISKPILMSKLSGIVEKYVTIMENQMQ